MTERERTGATRQHAISGLVYLSASLALVGIAIVGPAAADRMAPVRGARMSTATALQGVVNSADEKSMAGVLVSARRRGSTITVTVVSDADGHYAFPSERLAAGHYTLSIRAIGFDLAGSPAIDLVAGKPARLDLDLVPTKDLEAQLSNADWLQSVPGTMEQKSVLLNCDECHTLNGPLESAHGADEFVQVMTRMSRYAYNASIDNPQLASTTLPFDPQWVRSAAQYLASINRSSTSGVSWPYTFKPQHRVTGPGTHAIITQYDLPRAISQPHDVVTDRSGHAWYTDFGKQFIGRLDPETGAVKEYPVPQLRQNAPTGELDIENAPDGKLWVGMHFQAALGLFDPTTEKLRVFAPRPDQLKGNTQLSMVAAAHQGVDGKIWTGDAEGVWRLDVKSGVYERIYPFGTARPTLMMPGLIRFMSVLDGVAGSQAKLPPGGVRAHALYGLATDSHNNLYANDFAGESIFKIDAKTSKVSQYPTATAFSRPRRGHMDDQDRLWFAEYYDNKIGCLDTRTGKMTEWGMPPWTAPYDVQLGPDGNAWVIGMNTDRLVRLDPATGQTTEYQLPASTNGRRIFVAGQPRHPVIWVGNNHAASIMRIEPLD